MTSISLQIRFQVMRISICAGVFVGLSYSFAIASPTCKPTSNLNSLREQIKHFDSASSRDDRIPTGCYDAALGLISELANKKTTLTIDDLHTAIDIDILLDRDDMESDLARKLDLILHKDVQRFQPIFKEHANKIQDRCKRLNYIDHIRSMDCQVEHHFDPGEESSFCLRDNKLHPPSAELMACRDK